MVPLSPILYGKNAQAVEILTVLVVPPEVMILCLGMCDVLDFNFFAKFPK